MNLCIYIMKINVMTNETIAAKFSFLVLEFQARMVSSNIFLVLEGTSVSEVVKEGFWFPAFTHTMI